MIDANYYFSDDCVDFDEFISGLSIFGSDASIERKLKCLINFIQLDFFIQFIYSHYLSLIRCL